MAKKRGTMQKAKAHLKSRSNRRSNGSGRDVRARNPKPKGPKAQPLPGMEQVRNVRLDRFCESIAEERETMNQARQEEAGLLQGALQEMLRSKTSVYKHARVELVLVPGTDKLRVHVLKEDTDAEVEEGASRRRPAKPDTEGQPAELPDPEEEPDGDAA